MLDQLRARYRFLSDDQLLELAAYPADLTKMAQEALGDELVRRDLRLTVEEVGIPPGHKAVSDKSQGRCTCLLVNFYDSVNARRACTYLEERGLAFEIRDRSVRFPKVRAQLATPMVSLDILVCPSDLALARNILREEMEMFPLQDIAESDDERDGEAVLPIGYFGYYAEADECAKVLDRARILHRISTNIEGTVEDQNAYTLEVRECDLIEAGECIGKMRNIL